jgi:hypothetical protein
MKQTPGRGRAVTRTTTTTTTTTKQIPNRPRNPTDAETVRPQAERPSTRPDSPATSSGRPKKDAGEQARYSIVDLRLHEIRCIKSTKEIDKDEPVIAAVKVEGAVGGTKNQQKLAARAERGQQISAGKFANGDKHSYPNSPVLASYDAGGRIGSEPRYFFGALVFIEEDEGKIDSVITSTVNAVEKQVVDAVTKAAASVTAAALSGAVSGAALGSAIPLFGTAIGAAAGAAVGVALGEIKAAGADDVFPQKMVELMLARFPDEPGEIDGSRKTVTFQGFKGHYEVTIFWSVR